MSNYFSRLVYKENSEDLSMRMQTTLKQAEYLRQTSKMLREEAREMREMSQSTRRWGERTQLVSP
ncbi:MAG: hypothetical protein ABJE63_11850 [Lentilitoribacter sp.]